MFLFPVIMLAFTLANPLIPCDFNSFDVIIYIFKTQTQKKVMIHDLLRHYCHYTGSRQRKCAIKRAIEILLHFGSGTSAMGLWSLQTNPVQIAHRLLMMAFFLNV